MSTPAIVVPSDVSHYGFSREQIDLIKRVIAPEATDDELKLFLAQCQRTGLDPFDRQIYFQKRRQWNSRLNDYEYIGKAETSIDGFRVIADRSGEMDGQELYWCGTDGQWLDVWLEDDPPVAAKVLVYRRGCAHAFPGVAKYREFVQITKDGKPNMVWRKMASNQISKCAEAAALRRAFPKQLSGLYTADEMAQAENPPARNSPPPVAPSPETIDQQQPPPLPLTATEPIPAPSTDQSPEAPPKSKQPIWKAAPNGDALVIDPDTGEEVRISPPNGHHFIWDYKRRGVAHIGKILNFDSKGGAVEISTIYEAGDDLKRAAIEHLPVRVQTSPTKPPSPGKLYLDHIWFFNEQPF